ncbi:hypothetical protein F5Y19DRAFT_286721 [Xylariaceae sp. FL1651]|nr:hypothetical protein F5Y19DRAFT_286721 [Xylariaceae sp. FL1651]
MASSSSPPTIPPPPPSSPPPSSSQPQPQMQTQPPPQQQLQQQQQQAAAAKYNNTHPVVHAVALGVTPLALLALCLPPRRVDLRAAMLGGVALWGTNQLTHDFSGRSFAQRFSGRMAALSGTELPAQAKVAQARIREEKERRARLRASLQEQEQKDGGSWTDERKRVFLEAYERQKNSQSEDQDGSKAKEGEEKKKKGVLEKIWMGDADPDWKEKRDQKEKEALQEGGGGYWGLITDQIAEVWGGGKKTGEDNASNGKASGDDAKKP